MHDHRCTEATHTEATDRLYDEADRRARWQYLYVPLLRLAAFLAVALVCMLALAALGDCGNVAAEPLGAVAESRLDPDAFALGSAALAWQPDAQPRSATVYELAGYVVKACREVVGSRLGDDCGALLMALSWRESRWRPGVTGRPPWLAVGAFQIHGAALDTWTRAEARDLRRNTMLAAWWLTECDRACVGLEESLVMYATGTCDGGDAGRRARWGARRLIRMAREMREGAGGGT